MQRSARPRKTVKLSGSLHKQLSAYALAASAAGVGALALAQPVEAKIVYTPAHVKIGYGAVNVYNLDLNHDGLADFYIGVFSNSCTTECEALLSVARANRNGAGDIEGTPKSSLWADALRGGAKIDHTKEFGGPFALMAGAITSGTSRRLLGYWANGGKGVKNRYLGLRFELSGQTHYAWARLNVRLPESGERTHATAILTGYAYETIPNKPIITGKTHGKDDATLGRLAQGASGLSAWRQKQ